MKVTYRVIDDVSGIWRGTTDVPHLGFVSTITGRRDDFSPAVGGAWEGQVRSDNALRLYTQFNSGEPEKEVVANV